MSILYMSIFDFSLTVVSIPSTLEILTLLPFLLDIFFIPFQMLSPFRVSPPENLYSIPDPCFYEVVPPPTHPLLPQRPSIPLGWLIETPIGTRVFPSH